MKNKLMILQLLMWSVVSVVRGMDELVRKEDYALVRRRSSRLSSFATLSDGAELGGEPVDDGVSVLGPEEQEALARPGQEGEVFGAVRCALVTDGLEEEQGALGEGVDWGGGRSAVDAEQEPVVFDEAEFKRKANDYLLSLWILRRYDPRFFYSSDLETGKKPVADLRGAMLRYLKECVEGDFDDSSYCAKIVELATEYFPQVLREEFEMAKASWDTFWWRNVTWRDERFRALGYKYDRPPEQVERKHLYDLETAKMLWNEARKERCLRDLREE